MGRILLLFITFCIIKSSALGQVLQWDTAFCNPATVGLKATYTFNGMPAKSWAWTMPGATPATASDSVVSFSYNSPGRYRVDLTMIGADNSVIRYYYMFTVWDPSPPANTLGEDTTYCGDFSRVLDAGNEGSTYLWSPGGETTRTITVTAPGTYSVNVKNNCYTGTFDIVLTRARTPYVDLGPDGFVCFDDPRTLNPQDNDGISYLWTTGAITRTIEVSASDTFGVYVTNADGCTSYDEIIVKDSCPPDIFIPNAFSPNGDRVNDVFLPYLNGIEKVKFNVYDRWGELLFTTEELGKGWDGKFQGELCQQDVYFWTLSLRDNAGYKDNRSGMFLLLR